METDWEYACFKGSVMIGEPGTEDHATAVFYKNYFIGMEHGDLSRLDYCIMRRRVCRGRWIPRP